MSSGRTNTLKGARSAPVDSDDDYEYEEVPIEDEWSLTEGEEDLEATVKAIQDRAQASAATSTASITGRPETVDQFLRSFLLQMGMTDTLDRFQTEWNEMVQRGQLDAERVELMPEVYIENLRLESDLKNAQREREEYRQASSDAADTLVRVQKIRDFHRLQHKRVVQEKNRLIEDMRKLKVQCNNNEPAVKRINEKYQTVLKQTTLVTLGRDKALGQVRSQSTEAPAPSHGPLCGKADEAKLK